MAARSPIVDVDLSTLDALLQRIKPLVLPEDFTVLHAVVNLVLEAVLIFRQRRSEWRKIRRIFGFAMSEKARDVLRPTDAGAPPQEAAEPADGTASDDEATGADGAGPAVPAVAAPANDDSTTTPPEPPAKIKNHGRIPAASYRAAEHVPVRHESLRHGDPCSRCEKGYVYTYRAPAPIVRIFGQAPLVAKCWDCDCFRCGACGHMYTAQPPDEARGPKYDETAVSIVALLRYDSGVPFHRLDALQSDLETPLPASTQWDIVDEGAELLEPAYDELVRAAAQAEVFHNDDSYMRILEFQGKRREKLVAEAALPDPERTGIYTTAVVAIVKDVGPIAIYRTGRKHAGENLAIILELRDKSLPPPIQMGDALTRNLPKGHVVEASLCIAHGRRKIVDEIDNYPVECRFIIENLGLVYKVDDDCKERGDSDDKRLLAHQTTSAPLMEAVRERMQRELDDKRIEPNSDMGRAFNYFLKGWGKFTLFLRKAGAPLDNNFAERVLKRSIRNRRASLFYKTQHGADVGDLYMALIHTAHLHGVNPFAYLTAMLRNYKAVAENPAGWMPWTFRKTLASLTANAPKTTASHAVAGAPAPLAA